MNKLKITVVILLLTGAVGSIYAIDLTKWEYQADVTFGEDIAEYCKLEVTPAVYDAAKRDLADIRLMDPDGQQKPYLLIKPRDISERHRYSLTMLNRSTDDSGNSLVTLDFGRQVMKNSIEVATDGRSFRRSVKVEGSNDNVTFFTVVERAYVFAVGDKDDSRFEAVDLPANDYRYLRIAVEPMTSEDGSPVIRNVEAFRCVKKPAQRQPVQVTYVKQEEDKKYNLSIYEYDLDFRNLPVSEVKLEITDESFYRYVTVEGRNAATRTVRIHSEDNRERFREVEVPWTRIGRETIYRYTTAGGKKHENLTLSISRPAYRYLRVTIKNYDDRPLDIRSASAEMIPGQLIFLSENDTAAVLYVGAGSASSPKYDISQRLREPSKVKTSPAMLGSVIENPIFGEAEEKLTAWTEKHKVLLLVVLGVIVAVTGLFMLKSFKTIQVEQGDET